MQILSCSFLLNMKSYQPKFRSHLIIVIYCGNYDYNNLYLHVIVVCQPKPWWFSHQYIAPGWVSPQDGEPNCFHTGWTTFCLTYQYYYPTLACIVLASHLCTRVLHTLKSPKFFHFHGDFHQKCHFAHPKISFAHPELPFLAMSMLACEFQGFRVWGKICISNAGTHGHTNQFSQSGQSRSRSWPIMQCPITRTWESAPKQWAVMAIVEDRVMTFETVLRGLIGCIYFLSVG